MKTENYIEHASQGFDGVAAILRRQKTWFVLGLVLGLLTAFAFTQLVPTQYTATAHVYVGPPGATPGTAHSDKDEIDMASQRELAQSEKTATVAAEELGDSWTSKELFDGVDVTADSESTILSVSFTADSAERAVEGATGMAQAYIKVGSDAALEQRNSALASVDEQIGQQQEELDALENSLAYMTPGQQAQAETLRDVIADLQERRIEIASEKDLSREIITGADANPVDAGPSTLRTLILGLLGGLTLGVVLAVIAHATSRRPSDSAEIENIVGAPVFRPSASEGDENRWSLATIFARHATGMGKSTALLIDDGNEASLNAANAMAPSLVAESYGLRESWIDAVRIAGTVDAVVIIVPSSWSKAAIGRLRDDLDKVDAHVVGVVVADAKPEPAVK